MWADAWRACQLGIRRLKNLGNKDFLQIGDRLVFSCLRIILWWSDVMLSWIFDYFFPRWFLQMLPLPLDFMGPILNCYLNTFFLVYSPNLRHPFHLTLCSFSYVLNLESTRLLYDRPTGREHASSLAYFPRSSCRRRQLHIDSSLQPTHHLRQLNSLQPRGVTQTCSSSAQQGVLFTSDTTLILPQPPVSFIPYPPPTTLCTQCTASYFLLCAAARSCWFFTLHLLLLFLT